MRAPKDVSRSTRTSALGRTRIMSNSPSVTDLLQVVGSAGLLIGACVGFFVPGVGMRRIAENIVLVATLGGIVGAFVAFALYLGILVGGAT